MKRFINKLSLLLALILVINSCNTFCIMEAKAEDTSSLTIKGVNLDTSNAADISKERILTSKELSVSVNTSSSSGDVQTFTLYRKNGEEKEAIKSIDVTPNDRQGVYVAETNLNIEVSSNIYSVGEYCVGVKSNSHTTEVIQDIEASLEENSITYGVKK